MNIKLVNKDVNNLFEICPSFEILKMEDYLTIACAIAEEMKAVSDKIDSGVVVIENGLLTFEIAYLTEADVIFHMLTNACSMIPLLLLETE